MELQPFLVLRSTQFSLFGEISFGPYRVYDLPCRALHNLHPLFNSRDSLVQ